MRTRKWISKEDLAESNTVARELEEPRLLVTACLGGAAGEYSGIPRENSIARPSRVSTTLSNSVIAFANHLSESSRRVIYLGSSFITRP